MTANTEPFPELRSWHLDRFFLTDLRVARLATDLATPSRLRVVQSLRGATTLGTMVALAVGRPLLAAAFLGLQVATSLWRRRRLGHHLEPSPELVAKYPLALRPIEVTRAEKLERYLARHPQADVEWLIDELQMRRRAWIENKTPLIALGVFLFGTIAWTYAGQELGWSVHERCHAILLAVVLLWDWGFTTERLFPWRQHEIARLLRIIDESDRPEPAPAAPDAKPHLRLVDP